MGLPTRRDKERRSARPHRPAVSTLRSAATPAPWDNVGYHGPVWASKGTCCYYLPQRRFLQMKPMSYGMKKRYFTRMATGPQYSCCVLVDKSVGEFARRPVSRVLSIPRGTGQPFLWDAPCGAPRAANPGGGAGTPLRHAGEPAPPTTPIRPCSRWGLPCRPRRRGRGALLPHRFTLARRPRSLEGRALAKDGRSVLCGTVPGVAPAGR